jgi:hypothetical protein
MPTLRPPLLCALLILSGCADEVEQIEHIPFEQSAWIEANTDGDYPTVRQQMLADLTERHSFEEMSRTDVIELLGEPTSTEPASSGLPQFDIIYYLGIENGGPYALDDEALGFKFGPDDRVVDWGVSVN